MPITTTAKAVQGWNKVAGDCVAIAGLVSVQIRKVNYRYQPADQPRSVVPQRVVTLVQSTTDNTTDFYGFAAPQNQWTILITEQVNGAPRSAKYEMMVAECSLKKVDDTTTEYTTVLISPEGKLLELLARKDYY